MRLTTLLSVLMLGLIGCSTTYPSQRQAMDACREWEEGAREVPYDAPSHRGKGLTNHQWSRRCDVEEVTNQVLGSVNKTIEEIEWRRGTNEGTFEVVKNFRY